MTAPVLKLKGAFRTCRRQAAPVRVPTAKPAGPTAIARRLALAHHVDAAIERGDLASYAEAADRLGLTRARTSRPPCCSATSGRATAAYVQLEGTRSGRTSGGPSSSCSPP